MKRVLSPRALVLTYLAVSGVTRPAHADTFNNDVSAVGANARVEVRYDQRTINNKVVHKHFVIYEGASVADVRDIVDDALKQDAITTALHAKREEEAFDALRARVEQQMRADHISTDGLASRMDVVVDSVGKIVEILTRPPSGHLLLAAGWVGDSSATRWTIGGLLRLELGIVIGDPRASFRHTVFVALSGDMTDPEQFVLAPDGIELERGIITKSYRGLAEFGYAPSIGLNSLVALLPYAALGAGGQMFSSSLSDDPSFVAGMRAGVAAWLFPFDKVSVRVGVEYSLQSVNEPTYRFRGLDVDHSPERGAENSLRAYLAGGVGVL